jgi:hypothetical protein
MADGWWFAWRPVRAFDGYDRLYRARYRWIWLRRVHRTWLDGMDCRWIYHTERCVTQGRWPDVGDEI